MRSFIKKIILYILPLYQRFLVWRLRYKETINVVFFAMSLPMWRYQHLYELMKEHHKFKVYIIIQPIISDYNQALSKDVNDLKSFFTAKGIEYTLGVDANGIALDIRKVMDPDIIFYPQPYYGYYVSDFSYNSFIDKLICYFPYAFWTAGGNWSYNLPFHNIAWKLFYSTGLHKKDAKKMSQRKGHNVEVVGYPSSDDFLKVPHKDIWRDQSIVKKRVIWASHFTISPGLLYQSNFLWMSEVMLDIAKIYFDKIQFAFKPHPRLFSELCKHPDWGEERAIGYYQEWQNMENSQIETGEFTDLFMTSDAMIHDCGSFTVEYHYSGNPVMYIAKNFEEQLKEKNDFGKIAMNLHYVGKCKQDIIDFIENVVLAGEDPLKPQRQQFLEDYLIPPHGKTVAENTMDVLLRELC